MIANGIEPPADGSLVELEESSDDEEQQVCEEEEDDDAELDDPDFVESTEETIEKMKRGEVVWSRSDCDCQVCIEMNRAEDEWPAVVELANRGEGGLAFRAMVRAVESREGPMNEVLNDLMFQTGRAPATRAEISRRGRL